MMTLDRMIELNRKPVKNMDVFPYGIFRLYFITKNIGVLGSPLFFHDGRVVPNTDSLDLANAHVDFDKYGNSDFVIRFRVDDDRSWSSVYNWRSMNLNGDWVSKWCCGDERRPFYIDVDYDKVKQVAPENISTMVQHGELTWNSLHPFIHQSDDVLFYLNRERFYQLPKNQSQLKPMLNQVRTFIAGDGKMSGSDFEYVNNHVMLMRHLAMTGITDKGRQEIGLGLDDYNAVLAQLSKKFYKKR